jgi:LysM repeat protein
MPANSAPAALRTPPATPVIIASPTPTPTPFTHIVQRGETLIGIAIRYGLSLDALQKANPTVSAQFLSVGAALIIPASDDVAVIRAASAPTPLPVQFGEPACYPQATGALICAVVARNPGAATLEALSARVTLAGADGLPLAEAVALPALDVLPPGSATPLLARFAPPLVSYAAVGVTPLTAFPLADVTSRLVPVLIRTVGASATGQGWTSSGEVVNESALAAARVRLTLVLWTETGAVAGLQQLDLDPALAPGEARKFVLTAASLAGPQAVRAEVLAEGRP